MRKFHSLALFILMCLVLVTPTVPGAGMSEPVGVRITGASFNQVQNEGLPFEVLIDYGSFLWGVLPSGELHQLDRLDLDILVIDSPFSHARDQALTPSSQFMTDTLGNTKTGQAGLFLLQFQGPTKDEWLGALEADGLEILQYLHPFTYLVWGQPSDLQKSLSLPFIRQRGVLPPGHSRTPRSPWFYLNAHPDPGDCLPKAGPTLPANGPRIAGCGMDHPG